MVMWRQENGVKKRLTAEEEAETLARWAANDTKKLNKKIAREARHMRKQQLCQRLGITEDDMTVLCENFND